MTNFIASHEFENNISNTLQIINDRIEYFGFSIWPLVGDPHHGIPNGFCTIGFTRVGLPEFYISGVLPHSTEGMSLCQRLKKLFESVVSNAEFTQVPSIEFCAEYNVLDFQDTYQARPVDPTRFLYSQATMARYWAEQESLVDQVTVVQLVHRNDDNHFPYDSSAEQLLLDYVPFGEKLPVNPVEIIQ